MLRACIAARAVQDALDDGRVALLQHRLAEPMHGLLLPRLLLLIARGLLIPSEELDLLLNVLLVHLERELALLLPVLFQRLYLFC